MNACVYCRTAKRKCDKTRPKCSNCQRLGRTCVYAEDSVQTHFVTSPASQPDAAGSGLGLAIGELAYEPLGARLPKSASGIDLFSHDALRQPTVDLIVRTEVLRILGSFEKMTDIAAHFFTGTHQRIPTLSRSRFYTSLKSIAAGPRADFAVLCLCIYLVEQMPLDRPASVRSSLYVVVKGLISLLEATSSPSLDIVQGRILLAIYEMGHGLHSPAYTSVASCARTARALGLHRKIRHAVHAEANKLEEERRAWWAIVAMDRFIGLCNGDALFATEDPAGSDLLPIEDLLWSENSETEDLKSLVVGAPTLSTPANVTVGQMARECQASYLAGRVAQHVFSPTANPEFNADEAVQLERTLQTIAPLLTDEDLALGRYCGALGICDSALFTLYESRLDSYSEENPERLRLLESMQSLSERVVMFAEAGAADKEIFHLETLSPYLPYCLYQAAVMQYRLWKQKDEPSHKERLDTLTSLLQVNSKRWAVAGKYQQILANLREDWPPMLLPPQGHFIGRETGTMASVALN